MRFSILSGLLVLPALALSTAVPVTTLPHAEAALSQITSAPVIPQARATPAVKNKTVKNKHWWNRLELRQEDVGLETAATPSSDVGFTTTEWVESEITVNGVSTTTYVAVIYTQTFATSVLGPLASAGSGSIGLLAASNYASVTELTSAAAHQRPAGVSGAFVWACVGGAVVAVAGMVLL